MFAFGLGFLWSSVYEHIKGGAEQQVRNFFNQELYVFASILFPCYAKNVMKAAFTIFLITGFLGIAVFGAFAVNHGADHGHSGCIAATAQGTDCPKEENTLSFLNFHLNAFRSFSMATFGENFANVLILLIALVSAVAFGIIVSINPATPALATNYHRRQFLESYSFPFQREFTYWLALHENSPAIP